MVPLLTGLQGLSQHRAHGTSLAIVVFVGAAGLTGYWLTENVAWDLVIWLTLGSMVGSYLGARTMVRIPERSLRLIFGLFLLAVAVRMFIS
jgi:uncharacterized membrane protein YfcA